jgi:hypothetical protein
MAETTHLLSVLDKATHQLARLVSVNPENVNDGSLSCICSPVATALSVESSPGASAASFLKSNGVYKLARFLGCVLKAAGKSPLFSITGLLQITWDLALVFLQDLVAKWRSTALWQPWLTQLLDGGMTDMGSFNRA